ncbi:transcriptional regulator [Martelella alba]|uniref:Helix-turn-helix domain-containing protein n=1 Tax=Martelella alba TaxID=2590451 RepID=A0ABY2SEH8_9HYPH|nr:YdaS family helix-turn-helix protein [Martelella alba]TKI02412.1 helix-turn-helix domain-containing protein [Martelella alba]
MELKKYIDSLGRGEAKKLATVLGVSSSFLSQMASGRCAISPARCVEIENATNGVVGRKDLRPEDWAKIWPELEAA